MQFKQHLASLVRRIALMSGVLVLLALFGLQTLPAAADSMAFVRVVHASPDAGTVDVYVDGAKLLSGFQFGKVTGYVPVPAGDHKIQVTPGGKDIAAAVITQTVSVSAGVPYTVAALGTKSSGFSLEGFADNNLVNGNMAKVRVYHLSPDAGPVNVATGGNTVITGLTYQHASDYLSVPAGSYTFNVTATQANATVPVPATLNPATVTSVFALGLLNGSPKLQFVPAQVAGVPGMPGTGSDPNAVTANPGGSQTQFGWFVLILAFAGIGFALVSRRMVLAYQKSTTRSHE